MNCRATSSLPGSTVIAHQHNAPNPGDNSSRGQKTRGKRARLPGAGSKQIAISGLNLRRLASGYHRGLREDSRLPRDPQDILQELLVLRCQRGERRAFDELIRHWEERLFYYIRRLVATEEDAWDVLQQTWIKAFKGIKTLRTPERLPIWLYQIARCTALSHWRGHFRQQARIEENRDLTKLAAADEIDRFDDSEQVHLGLSRLAMAHREVLTLHFLEDFSLDQMAEILDVPTGTVKSRLFYAKRALLAVLERKEDGP